MKQQLIANTPTLVALDLSGPALEVLPDPGGDLELILEVTLEVSPKCPILPCLGQNAEVAS